MAQNINNSLEGKLNEFIGEKCNYNSRWIFEK